MSAADPSCVTRRKRMRPWMVAVLRKVVRALVVLIAVVILSVVGTRIYFSETGAPLETWHTYAPEELGEAALDKADWPRYLDAEERALRQVEDHVVQAQAVNGDGAPNRYLRDSVVYPPSLTRDWNRSYELLPPGPPRGAVVLLHGLTDSPYSLRHVGRIYADAGFVVVGIRLPGHGTVPAGLADVAWTDWMAATRLAVREARARSGADVPLHIVGFSNGGALALKYALDAVGDPSLPRVDRLILVSPMIGITRFARFAGIAALPSALPRFAKAAWLSVLPEFNPFKYNSFPVNGAVQSHRLTRALQRSIVQHADNGTLGRLPPTLTFQSVLDFTVSTRAIVTSFYALLPDNGSELVLFDINHRTKLGPLLRRSSRTAVDRLLPAVPRAFATTVVTNAGADAGTVVQRRVAAGATEETVRALTGSFPADVFSLSHVALPFPPSDGLYGSDPDPHEDFGVQLGAMAIRGERGALVIRPDALIRMSSNPFFASLADRVKSAAEGAPARHD